MKRTLMVMLILCLVTFAGYGQEWGWTGSPGADTLRSYGHGVAIDGEGKLWYNSYYWSETVEVDTGARNCLAIYIFNADGTEASFSPITMLTVDGVTDTLWPGSNKGLRTDINGDIVYAESYSFYRINHLNGEATAKLVTPDSSSVCAAAFTDAGEMIVNHVLPGMGIEIYDADWELIDEAVPGEMQNSYSRVAEVAKDGSAIYYNGFTNGVGFVRFNSDSDIYGDFTSSIDTLALGLSVESTAWQPVTGYLWGGNTGGAGWTNAAHYAFDAAGDFTTAVDSILMPASVVDLGIKPRGIAFTDDGMTAYVTFFNTWDSNAIYKFEKGGVGVWEHTGTMITGYALKANYPNPFNPSTKLDVVLKDGGVADLRIYDMRGAEVAVLNNSYLSAGEHTFTFDASQFAAGVYIAKFTANGAMYTQTMTLVK
ncbi:MAG: T9SS type A sorting domain-containing protein [Candidatus Marinimicrobia bacterium]|nr:T9SS type A sorting domain-containing protein [Candidatus Neomarinimicrobiota bacterium]